MPKIQYQPEPPPEKESPALAANDNEVVPFPSVPEAANDNAVEEVPSIHSIPEAANDNETLEASLVLPQAANDNSADAQELAGVRERLGMIKNKEQAAEVVRELSQATPEGIDEVTEAAPEAVPGESRAERTPTPNAETAQAASGAPDGDGGNRRRANLRLVENSGAPARRGGIFGKIFKGIGKILFVAGAAIIAVLGALYSLGMNAVIQSTDAALSYAGFKKSGGGGKKS